MLKKISKLLIIPLGLIVMSGVAQAQFSTTSTVDTTQVSKPLDRVKNILGETPSYNYDTNEESLMAFVSDVINIFLGILGSIFIFLIVYAGYLWMTAAGDASKVEKAQHTLKVAIIGLIVIAGSYAIWQFLFVRLLSN